MKSDGLRQIDLDKRRANNISGQAISIFHKAADVKSGESSARTRYYMINAKLYLVDGHERVRHQVGKE